MNAAIRIRSNRSVISPRGRRAGRESGFAYILALMIVTALMIASMVAMEKGLAHARRRQEALTIWRGEQYVRAIRLYYRKTNHYPQTIDDLEKGIGNVHFLRPEAYKNPMNKQDGSWRLIYVNPAGQIIGSVRYANLQQMALIVLNNGQLPQPTPGQSGSSDLGSSNANSLNGATNSSSGTGSQNPSGQNPNGGNSAAGPGDTSGGNQNPENPQSPENPQNPPGSQNPSNTQNPPNSQNPTPSQNGFLPSANTPPGLGLGMNSGAGQAINPLLLMKPTGPVSGPVIGGFLTGVALISKAPSQKVYQGGKTYEQWEFIWNPLVDQARALQSGMGQGATGSIGGVAGQGANPGMGPDLGATLPVVPGTQPPQPQPNQPQQPPQQPQQPQ
jgi:hypothetical protein